MKRVALAFVILSALCGPALAQTTTISGLPAATTLGGTEIVSGMQGTTTVKIGVSQIKALANTSAFTTQTGTNYAIVATDVFTVLYLNNAANQVPTIPQAGTTGFETGKYLEVCNIGAGTQTITPTTSTIGGGANYVLPAGSAAAPKCVGVNSDGTNYRLDLTGVSSGGGGGVSLIASGTAAMGTGAIASGFCATAVTVAATGVATTDVISASFNGDPTAVTGYVPLTTGMLAIIPYPSANNVNFKVCNNTSASITPGAITLNWRVAR
jgi:hypothetical protein